MKTLLIKILAVSAFVALSVSNTFADDLERLSGKWSLKRNSSQGEAVTQAVEIKKDKFTFKIVNSDNKVVIYVEGDIKLEKLGPFKSIKFFNMKAGASASELEPISEDRISIYQLGEGTWTLASNFDEERDQKPSVDVYKRAQN